MARCHPLTTQWCMIACSLGAVSEMHEKVLVTAIQNYVIQYKIVVRKSCRAFIISGKYAALIICSHANGSKEGLLLMIWIFA